jgi:DUF2975 family protein
MTAPNPSIRLRRLCRAMKTLTTFGMLFIAIGMVAIFCVPDWTRDMLVARLGLMGDVLPLAPARVIAGAAIAAVPVGVLLYGLWQARQLFADFADGFVFMPSSARRLRDFALAILAQAVLQPIAATAMLLVFTYDNPPGNRQLVIALSSNDYLALIIGGMLLAIAWVLVEATRIADEHASFV